MSLWDAYNFLMPSVTNATIDNDLPALGQLEVNRIVELTLAAFILLSVLPETIRNFSNVLETFN